MWVNVWLPMWYNNLGLFIIISNITPRSHRNAEYHYLGGNPIHKKPQKIPVFCKMSPPLPPYHAVGSSVGALSLQSTPRLKVTTLHCTALCMTEEKIVLQDIIWLLCQAYCDSVLDPKVAKRDVLHFTLPAFFLEPRFTQRHLKALCSSYKPWFLLFPFLL